MSEQQQSQLKKLIARGKEKGFLTYAEVNDHLPDDIVDPEQIEDIIAMINDMGIEVHEFVPDTETLLLNENPVSADDDVVAEEAAAALAAVDSEFGRTTDPVRMYMREMGTVELLTREGEIQIAKRIEEGMTQVLSALAVVVAGIYAGRIAARSLNFVDAGNTFQSTGAFIAGNRDFLIGERFAASSRLTLLPEATVIALAGAPLAAAIWPSLPLDSPTLPNGSPGRARL